MVHQLLYLGAKWEMTGLVVREADGIVEIQPAETEAVWACASSLADGATLVGYDHRHERRWRLNTFECHCEIGRWFPRGNCTKCGKVTTIAALWQGMAKNFTLAFESMALPLMWEMPVKRVTGFVGKQDLALAHARASFGKGGWGA